MSVVDQYQAYVERKMSKPKETRYWRIAKQYADMDTDVVAGNLVNHLDESHWRANMPYRYLGLVFKPRGGAPSLTAVGQAFLDADAESRRAILDEQILKLWLANPTNTRLQIDLYPAVVLTQILLEIGHLHGDEYGCVVAWADEGDTIDSICSLIRDFRQADPAEREAVVAQAVSNSEVMDYGDNISRLHDLIASASYFKQGDLGVFGVRKLELTDIHFAEELVGEFLSRTTDGNLTYDALVGEFHGIVLAGRASSLAAQAVGSLTDEIVFSVGAGLSLGEPPSVPHAPVGDGIAESSRTNYAAKSRAQKAAGDLAELIVYKNEQDKVRRWFGEDALAKVRHVSADTDSLHYDVLSMDEFGSPVHIEVKSVTERTGACEIHLSLDEIRQARIDAHYQLHLVMRGRSGGYRIEPADVVLQSVLKAVCESDVIEAGAVVRPESWVVYFSPS